jgi:hypothetical protein
MDGDAGPMETCGPPLDVDDDQRRACEDGMNAGGDPPKPRVGEKPPRILGPNPPVRYAGAMMVRWWQGLLFPAGIASLTWIGCLLPPTSAQRLAESAYDFTNATRFGRTDIALEHVKPSSREEFGQQHRAWGRSVRVDDIEVSSFTMRKDGDADVTLTFAWHQMNDTTMRETEVVQRWTDERGTWWLVREEETSGDRGVLPEAAAARKAGVSAGSVPLLAVDGEAARHEPGDRGTEGPSRAPSAGSAPP